MGQGILEFPKFVIAEFRHCEALKKAEAISLGHRHCEALKKPKQSRLEFPKIRHCEGAKRPKQSH